MQIDIIKLTKDMKMCPVPDYQNVTSAERFNNQVDKMSCSLESNQHLSLVIPGLMNKMTKVERMWSYTDSITWALITKVGLAMAEVE